MQALPGYGFPQSIPDGSRRSTRDKADTWPRFHRLTEKVRKPATTASQRRHLNTSVSTVSDAGQKCHKASRHPPSAMAPAIEPRKSNVRGQPTPRCETRGKPPPS